jgi:hypothetical protein
VLYQLSYAGGRTNMGIIRRTTDEEATKYFERARSWYEEHGIKHFTDARSCAVYAVEEFLANQDGLTIFAMDEKKG